MEGPMIKPDIDALGVQERILLFCLGSGTDWKEAGVTPKTVAGMMWKYLVFPTWAPGGRPPPLTLTDAGRAALRALLRDL
jgi:hypothetical protein